MNGGSAGPERAHKCALALVAGLALPLSHTSAQEVRGSLYPRYEASAHASLLVLGETIRIDSERNPDSGTEIDAEEALGVSPTTFEPRIAFRWRPGERRRHEIEAGILRAVRSGDRTLTDTIVVGDTSFAAGVPVQARLRTTQAFLTYRYALTANEKTQFGPAVGLGAVFFRTEIDALISGPGGEREVDYSESRNLTGPTGSLGLYGRFRFGDRWYLESDIRGVFLKVGDIEAGVLELGAAGRYFISRTVGAELGYGLGYYAVEVDKTDSEGFLSPDFLGEVHYTSQVIRGGVVVQF
ncbi:MAG: hypothetical protein ACREMH_00020 [Gemmatimonadales bacterium]